MSKTFRIELFGSNSEINMIFEYAKQISTKFTEEKRYISLKLDNSISIRSVYNELCVFDLDKSIYLSFVDGFGKNFFSITVSSLSDSKPYLYKMISNKIKKLKITHACIKTEKIVEYKSIYFSEDACKLFLQNYCFKSYLSPSYCFIPMKYLR